MNKYLLALALPMLGLAAEAGDMQLSQVSNYAGQEKQAIKSLSPEDIAELRRGGGWGLAKAAELNGVPGPAHLLELKDRIPLDRAQVAALAEIFERMKAQAIQQGERLIALERKLDHLFQTRGITDAKLRASLEDIAEARKALRYIHLATHLKTPEILSPDQIATYNALRGYANPNPCAGIPEGHDAEMWRQHNGCK